MVATTHLRVQGSNIVAFRDNGTQRLFVPTAADGLYLPVANPGTPTGAGGGEDQSSPPTGGTPGSSAAPVDDYPWPNAPQDALSPLRYSYRDCTDFVAWRINRDLGVTSAPWMYTWGQLRLTNGDAIGWKPDWISHGWGVSGVPSAGMIGWYGTSAGAYGHVNYVQKVNTDGSIHVEEYNWSPNHQAYNERTIPAAGPYFPDSFLSMPPPR